MSDIERPYLKEDHDSMPEEKYAGLGYATHRYADYVPVADDKDQYALRQSVAEIGLLEPIVLFQGAILDGRHRYKACQVMGVEPRFIEFEGDEEQALQFVLAKNVARRQLTTIQKLNLREKLVPEIARLKEAALANQRANLTEGQVLVAPAGRVDEAIADMIGVSRETQRQFDAVKKIAEVNSDANEFMQQMLAGEIGVEKAYKQTKASVSDELDREARAQAGPTPAKQLTEIKALVNKAAALLAYDYDLVTADDELADKLDDLSVWMEEALLRARPF